MTAQILISELTTLIQDSKRKSPDIKSAAEKSLNDLKSLPNTSEAQLSADLKKRPQFAKPFVLSCASKNPKFAGTSISCLQRLVVSNSLAHETLKDVLGGLRDCTALAQDIQLKILQILPSLLQNYASLITDDLLATALHTCFLLLASKASVISHTAAATLQQLIVSVFDKVQQEDDLHTENFIRDVPIENGEISVQRSALDAYKVLNDLCLMAEGQKPEFLQVTSIPATLSLELIEAIFSNHAAVLISHPEEIHILRLKLMPFIIRVLSERMSFSITVRCMRLFPVILSNMLSVLASECEMVLSLLNHMLDPDVSVLWKRVLCMEVLRSIHSEPTLVRGMFARFDADEERRNIVQDQMSLMVHLASEKPAIIGLGQHSTIPVTDQGEEPMDEMAALQAEGISGTIGVAVTLKSSTAPGISARLSSMRISCLEQLDKTDPPTIPPAYMYSLALTCLNGFSEGIAKFLLPFTVPSDKSRRRARTKEEGARSRDRDGEGADSKSQSSRPQSSTNSRVPVNPLSLDGHVLYSQIKTSAEMVESCWPALLAAYSTFFHAALDNEYYRDLVRSFQKFTQISGLLHLSTPRDAFLTALGKNAVPVGSNTIISGGPEAQEESEDGKQSEAEPLSPSRRKQSAETGRASLNSRNLLCLRALLNLGIALGPVLGKAWSIVLSTLQQADIIIGHITAARQRGRGNQSGTSASENSLLGDIGDQINAVHATADRLLESTGDLPEDGYFDVLQSICALFRGIKIENLRPNMPSRSSTLSSPTGHKRGPSISGNLAIFSVDSKLNMFVIDQLSKLVQYNTFRFYEDAPNKAGWSILSNSLQKVASTQELDATLRVKAVRVLTDFVAITASSEVVEEHVEETRYLGLHALNELIKAIYLGSGLGNFSLKDCEVEIHCIVLETLYRALEQYGEALTKGWAEVFAIITSVFDGQDTPFLPQTNAGSIILPKVPGSKLIRTSFGSLQLICSDFLEGLPSAYQGVLLQTISSFCIQQEDFNISLTSTTLFCNVSDHLWQDETIVQLDVPSEAIGEIDLDKPLPKTSIWFLLLIALVESSTDGRSEIRRGAIHSIFRILDAVGEKLSPQSWIDCQNSVLIPLLIKNQARYLNAGNGKAANLEDAHTWNDTCTMIFDSIPSLYQTQMDGVIEQVHFSSLWDEFLKQLKIILQREALSVSASLFSALTKILSSLSETSHDITKLALAVWRLWQGGNPANHHGQLQKTADNQIALLAYARCFTTLYPLAANDINNNDIKISLDELNASVIDSSPTSYAGDIEFLTPLQDQIINCVKIIKTDKPDLASQVAIAYSKISRLATDRAASEPEAKGPTFVAISKTAIDLLSSHIINHQSNKELFTNGAIVDALDSLGKSIQVKYSWEQQGKDPQVWKKATQATAEILKATLPEWDPTAVSQTTETAFWEAAINSCSYIISSPDESASETQRHSVDQNFDVSTFLTLCGLIIPKLGNNRQPSQRLEALLARSFLKYSFVHEPHPDDLPTSNEDENPLSSIGSVHIGRTNSLEPSSRSKVSYAVTDKLFELVSATEYSTGASSKSNTAAQKRLAVATAPFFILRVSVPLKTYILDQPLRGRMPQPASQRKELLYMLRRLAELNSDPEAFGKITNDVASDARSATQYKRHLFLIHPFIVRALGVTKRDDDLRKALANILDIMSTEFNTHGLRA